MAGGGTVLTQLRKGQGETNERLERIAAALERMNELLAQVVSR